MLIIWTPGNWGKINHLKEREFIHVPLWGLTVVLLYCMRRLECKNYGIVVESVPWGSGKSPLTIGYAWFLSEWAKLLSMQEVVHQFKLTWHHVFSSVVMAVTWGRTRIDLTGITAIGVDEIYWAKGSFMTLVYQIDNHCEHCKIENITKEKVFNIFQDAIHLIGKNIKHPMQ